MSATIRSMRRFRAGALASLAILAGCTSNPVSTATPAPTPTPASTSAGDPEPTPTPVGPGTGVGQVDTEWGPIWERVPDAFPLPPSAEQAEADATVSGAWTVPSVVLAAPRDVAQFYEDRFSFAGLGGGMDGPLEDGSYTAWASNGYGCDILVTAQRRGDEETFFTVLYGSGCAFDWLAE